MGQIFPSLQILSQKSKLKTPFNRFRNSIPIQFPSNCKQILISPVSIAMSAPTGDINSESCETLKTHLYECTCKAVKFQLEGSPMNQCWCHCRNCLQWNQVTPIAACIYSEDCALIVSGLENIGIYNITPDVNRTFCKLCGFRLYNQLKDAPRKTFFAPSIQGFNFEPIMHVNCERMTFYNKQRFKFDALPKYIQYPLPYGTGELLTMNDGDDCT